LHYHNNSINGNIPGIYYLPKNEFEPCLDNTDLFDFLCQKKILDIKLKEYDGNIIEFKNFEIYKKYIENYKSNNTTRFFNKIYEKENNILVKESIIPLYDHLITKEQNWYKIISKTIVSKHLIPKIYNCTENSIEMEKLDMAPIAKEWSNLNIQKIIPKILDSIEVLHNTTCGILVNANEVEEDIEIEFYKKLISRFESIEGIIDTDILRYKSDIFHLARLATDEIKKEIIGNNAKIKYFISHGDLNFSNILTDGSEIKFIDPRAYFGKHENYGLAEYDLAKVMYALSRV